jgi:hypothetical protein
LRNLSISGVFLLGFESCDGAGDRSDRPRHRVAGVARAIPARSVPGVLEDLQSLAGVRVLEPALIDGQPAGHDVGAHARGVDDLLGVAQRGHDHLGLEIVVPVDLQDVPDELRRVVAGFLLPADERRDEQRAVLRRRQRLRRREHQRDVGADAVALELARRGDALLGGRQLDHEAGVQRGVDPAFAHHVGGVRKVRIDLHGHRELRVAGERVVLQPGRDVAQRDLERLAADLDVPRIGRHAVDAEGVIGKVDFIELCAVEKELHLGLPWWKTMMDWRDRRCRGRPATGAPRR